MGKGYPDLLIIIHSLDIFIGLLLGLFFMAGGQMGYFGL